MVGIVYRALIQSRHHDFKVELSVSKSKLLHCVIQVSAPVTLSNTSASVFRARKEHSVLLHKIHKVTELGSDVQTFSGRPVAISVGPQNNSSHFVWLKSEKVECVIRRS